MVRTDYLDRFEASLESGLVKILSGLSLLEGEVIGSDDITSLWNDRFIKEYAADALENFNDYPDAALAWAAFLGIGVAHRWDLDWNAHKDDPYRSYYGPHGWDDMDEFILGPETGYGPLFSEKVSDAFKSCAQAAQSWMRHEHIEIQTEEGFYILIRAFSVFYRLGAAVELNRAGYRKVQIN